MRNGSSAITGEVGSGILANIQISCTAVAYKIQSSITELAGRVTKLFADRNLSHQVFESVAAGSNSAGSVRMRLLQFDGRTPRTNRSSSKSTPSARTK